MILVEHKMKLVMDLCERLNRPGSMATPLAEGTPIEIRANAEVRRVYLGEG